jgi:hypothetical protein
MDLCCVYSSDNEVDISQIKDLLESNGIPTLIKNMHTQNLFSGVKIFSGHDPIAGTIEIHVSRNDVEKAMQILGVDKEDTEPSIDKKTNESNEKIELSTEYYEKRRVFFAFILSVFSFLFLPILFNIPNLIYFLKNNNKKMFYMLISITVVMGASSLFFVIS